MSKILRLSNPGFGDATFRTNDKRLKQVLSKYPDYSHCLSSFQIPNSICGGYNYKLYLFSQCDEIEAAVNELGLAVCGEFDESQPIAYQPNETKNELW